MQAAQLSASTSLFMISPKRAPQKRPCTQKRRSRNVSQDDSAIIAFKNRPVFSRSGRNRLRSGRLVEPVELRIERGQRSFTTAWIVAQRVPRWDALLVADAR
jgi:hypothetical protein